MRSRSFRIRSQNKVSSFETKVTTIGSFSPRFSNAKNVCFILTDPLGVFNFVCFGTRGMCSGAWFLIAPPSLPDFLQKPASPQSQKMSKFSKPYAKFLFSTPLRKFVSHSHTPSAEYWEQTTLIPNGCGWFSSDYFPKSKVLKMTCRIKNYGSCKQSEWEATFVFVFCVILVDVSILWIVECVDDPCCLVANDPAKDCADVQLGSDGPWSCDYFDTDFNGIPLFIWELCPARCGRCAGKSAILVHRYASWINIPQHTLTYNMQLYNIQHTQYTTTYNDIQQYRTTTFNNIHNNSEYTATYLQQHTTRNNNIQP